MELRRHIESVHKEECDVCSKVFKNKLELKKHVENVHIFEGDESTLENLGIIQKPEIMPRIKQKITQEESVHVTPPPVTPPKPIMQKKTFEFIPTALAKFRKRKEIEPLLSPNPKKSKKPSSTQNSHKCQICKKMFSKKYNVERHIEKCH